MRKTQTAETRKPEILENFYQVIIAEGIEGASIGKIARRMGIHPSLIIHYFKNKKNMTLALADFLIEKYEAPEFLKFDHIADIEKRFRALMDTIFSFEWSRTIDPGVHFCFYYLSFRNPDIRQRYKRIIRRFRDYLVDEFETYRQQGIIKVSDSHMAADLIVTLMEGLEFHAQFLSDDHPFERFASQARAMAINMLTEKTDISGDTLNNEY
ncbi:MAG: hypothetical protein DSY90_05095 [Deltaproteobacteria bacterium]|nr:MAG: hypothetical protein DSY90_05095 [Deltaproteobacteria bacterium]RUA02457.1 MAG: hypothetical protein DSY89_02805 [Deltaproteobacteria bacterium]